MSVTILIFLLLTAILALPKHSNSELHGMHLVVGGKREAGAHVFHNARGLVGLQVLEKSVIDRLLESSAFC